MKKIHALIVLSVMFISIMMWTKPVQAQTYQIVFFDNYINANPVSYCQCDSVKCVPPAGEANITWFASGVPQVQHGDTLVLATGIDDWVDCHYTGGQKTLGLHPMSSLISTLFPTLDTVCGTETKLLDALNHSAYGFNTYLWSNGATTQTITVGAGTYSVKVTNVCESISDTITIIEHNPTPPNLGLNRTICQGTYVSLTPGSGYTNYLWSTGATTATISVGTPGNYWVQTTNPGGCIDETSVQIFVLQSPTQDIGLVSLDTSTVNGDNQILWDNTIHTTNVTSVKFKRELTTNNYIEVGSVPYADGKWTDTVSSSTQTWRYKISLVDTCGNESLMSNYHQSIHLWVMPVTGGFNIEWTGYLEQNNANPVQKYNIYAGPSLNSLSFLTFVSGNVFTYTPTGSDSVYVVGAVLGSKGLLTEALSNPVTPNDTLGVKEWGNTISFTLYPNPTADILHIQTENVKQVQLIDGVGRILLTTDQKTINCADLTSGVYLIKVITAKGYGIETFIKQ